MTRVKTKKNKITRRSEKCDVAYRSTWCLISRIVSGARYGRRYTHARSHRISASHPRRRYRARRSARAITGLRSWSCGEVDAAGCCRSGSTAPLSALNRADRRARRRRRPQPRETLKTETGGAAAAETDGRVPG